MSQSASKQKYLQFKQSGGTGNDDLINEKKQWIRELNKNGMILNNVPEYLKKDKNIALAAVRQNGKALQFVPTELYNSEEYKPIKKIRENNSSGNIIIIEGS